jgi:hypothetical protein
MPYRIPYQTIFGTPFVGHLAANGPEFGEEVVVEAVFEEGHGPALE